MKFYNVVNHDIFVYGEIYDAFDAENFAKELAEQNGAEVTIHINSAGGNVFNAIAMGNALRNYAGKVTCAVEGLCCSAAVLISSACQHVQIAANSLMMIHPISVMLSQNYNAAQLASVQDALTKVQNAYEQTIKPRLKKAIDFNAETWFTAAEAVEYGLADEIAGQVSMQIDAAQDLIFVNKCAFNQHVPLRTVSTPKANEEVAAQILGLIRDQLKSGGEGVIGGQTSLTESERRISGIANFANGLT